MKVHAFSNARLQLSTPASSYMGPMICNPIGKPRVVNPDGMEAAGCPVRLNGPVRGVHPIVSLSYSGGVGRPASKAAIGRVGEIKKS